MTDLDGDGFADIVSRNPDNGNIELYLGTGNGEFTNAGPQIMPLDDEQGDPPEFRAFRSMVDRDGKFAMIVEFGGTRILALSLEPESNTLRLVSRVDVREEVLGVVGRTGPTGLRMFVLSRLPAPSPVPEESGFAYSLTIFDGGGGGSFESHARTLLPYSKQHLAGSNFDVCDLDGDGIDDVIFGTTDGLQVGLVSDDGTIRFLPLVPAVRAWDVHASVETTGNPPFIVGSAFSSNSIKLFRWSENNLKYVEAASVEEPWILNVASLGEGEAPLIVSGRPGALSVLQPQEEKEQFSFKSTSWLPLPNRVTNVAASDLNGDGRDEWLATFDAIGDEQPGVLIGAMDESGRWDTTRLVTSGISNSVSAIDSNLDGFADLVVGTVNGLYVFLGDGTGRFTTGKQVDTNDVRELSLITLSDGATGLAAASLNGSVVTIFRSSDQGLAMNHVVKTESPAVVKVADVNGDGIDDLFVSSFIGDSISVFLGSPFGFELFGVVPINSPISFDLAVEDGYLILAALSYGDRTLQTIRVGNEIGFSFEKVAELPVMRAPRSIVRLGDGCLGNGRDWLIFGTEGRTAFVQTSGSGDIELSFEFADGSLGVPVAAATANFGGNRQDILIAEYRERAVGFMRRECGIVHEDALE